MKTVTFQNPGLIDLRCIQVMGVSVKDSDQPIGYFGTGLKYAIAVLLRERQEILLWRGDTCFQFTARTESIRGKEFELVYMNDQPLGFTTELGKNWKLWQALRELESNCRDEGGVSTGAGILPLGKDQTTIIVNGEKFSREYDSLGKIFLSTGPLFKADEIEFHPGGGRELFYRGVRIHQLQKPTLFTINFTRGIDLTEDRTAGNVYDIQLGLHNSIVQIEDEDILTRILLCSKDYLEYDLDYASAWQEPSPAFMNICERHSIRVTESAFRLFLEHRPEAKRYEEFEPDSFDKVMLGECIEFCTKMGFPVAKYEIKFAVQISDLCLALAQRETKTIWLAKRAFSEGKKKLTSILIEEFIHLEHDLDDCTRTLQTFLFDSLVSLAERHILGRPL